MKYKFDMGAGYIVLTEEEYEQTEDKILEYGDEKIDCKILQCQFRSKFWIIAPKKDFIKVEEDK